jgi:hypothetical protein
MHVQLFVLGVFSVKTLKTLEPQIKMKSGMGEQKKSIN